MGQLSLPVAEDCFISLPHPLTRRHLSDDVELDIRQQPIEALWTQDGKEKGTASPLLHPKSEELKLNLLQSENPSTRLQ